jgi:membrane-associated phospholipid phosphatase
LPYTPYGYGAVGNLPFISEDASKSFPSGHETMAAVGFYSLVSLPFTVTSLNTKKIRCTLFIAAVCGAGLVAFGRLLAGAHYLSDVTIGSLIAICLLAIFHCQYCYGSKHLDS